MGWTGWSRLRVLVFTISACLRRDVHTRNLHTRRAALRIGVVMIIAVVTRAVIIPRGEGL